VQVSGSDVTLTGRVDSWAERQAATLSAWRTPGVQNVIDNLSLA
jgi:osmotically-inducible protein OsmY